MQTARPKNCKLCAFCEYWTGDCGLTYVNNNVGFKFDNTASGKCIKKNGAVTRAAASAISCHFYEPSREAKKLL